MVHRLRLHFGVGVREHHLPLAHPQHIAVKRAHLRVEACCFQLFFAVLEGALSELATLRIRIN